MKILIADDDLTLRSLLQAMVSGWGFQPCLAEDGVAAWEILQQDNPPSILLLDWEMPGLDGLQLCQKIRQNITANPPYIILLTARQEAQDIATGLEAGANDFISKPFKKIELQARINVAQRVALLQKERLTALSDARLAASVFTYALEGIIITNPDSIIIDVNRTYSELTGYSREDSLNHHASHFFYGEEQDIWQTTYRTGRWQGEINSLNKAGQEVFIKLSISAVKDETGNVTHYIGLLSDISNAKRHQQQLMYLATHDSLTSLANRQLLDDRLKQAIARVQRGENTLAVVYLDLDGFKAVNDSFGHSQGDKLLVQLATKLKAAVRETDTVARIGGDEFTLILTNLKHQKDCDITLERILEACQMTIEIAAQKTCVSASLGVSFYNKDDETSLDELYKQADIAMYEAKKDGKNCFKFYQQKRLA